MHRTAGNATHLSEAPGYEAHGTRPRELQSRHFLVQFAHSPCCSCSSVIFQADSLERPPRENRRRSFQGSNRGICLSPTSKQLFQGLSQQLPTDSSRLEIQNLPRFGFFSGQVSFDFPFELFFWEFLCLVHPGCTNELGSVRSAARLTNPRKPVAAYAKGSPYRRARDTCAWCLKASVIILAFESATDRQTDAHGSLRANR